MTWHGGTDLCVIGSSPIYVNSKMADKPTQRWLGGRGRDSIIGVPTLCPDKMTALSNEAVSKVKGR